MGYLDDLLLVPLGIWLALRLIPVEVMSEARAEAAAAVEAGKPVSRVAAVAIVIVWILLAALVILFVLQGGTV